MNPSKGFWEIDLAKELNQQNIKESQIKNQMDEDNFLKAKEGDKQTGNEMLSSSSKAESQTEQQIREEKTISKKKSEITLEEAEQFVKKIHSEIKPEAWIRNNYYHKLGLDTYSKEREDNLQKQQSYSNDNYNIVIFTPRTSDQIRNRYLSKLNIHGTESQEVARKRHQHFFIFDWDDTILCTSFLTSIQFLQITNDAKNLLKKLDQTSSTLLSKVVHKGDVYIITNAAKGWVQYSSKLYLPKTHQIVLNSHIKICSARSMFGEQYPGDFGRWKIQAFKHILQHVDKYLVTNLICIGDSNIQMEAAHCVGKQFYHGLIKTIKFRQNPKIDELIKQQQLVNSKLSEIFDSTKNLTIRLQRKGK